jgi:serine phosphatase RsbU (regulator of sigma subunit)
VTAPDNDPVLHRSFDDEYRILVVEDDDGDALLVQEMLVDTGLRHSLRLARTLADALTELRRGLTDCVLLDLNLPDASGLPFMHAVQDAAPSAAIIVLTGLAETGSGAAAMANGAQDYLVKGQVDADTLKRALRYAVNRKQAERAGAELIENRVRAEENVRLERGLLPTPLLDSPSVAATTRYLPSREHALLGGDFLDVVQTSDGVVHAIIGDVSGHGPAEAALGVCLRITWRALILAGHRAEELLDLLEQVLVVERSEPEIFATCTTVSLDLETGSATLFLAGHHEPLLLESQKSEPVRARHSVAMGIVPGRHAWKATEFALDDSGALLFYTDGLVEGHDSAGDSRLGLHGLLALIAAAPTTSAEPFLDHLIDEARALDTGRHADDVAILHLAWDRSRHRIGGSEHPARSAHSAQQPDAPRALA